MTVESVDTNQQNHQRTYKDDPTIMGTDQRASLSSRLLRENCACECHIYSHSLGLQSTRIRVDKLIRMITSNTCGQAWVREMTSNRKSLDNRYMLEIGMEGFYGDSTPEREAL